MKVGMIGYGSITFEMMSKIIDHKIAKAVPSVTAEINRSQTLLCCNSPVSDDDKIALENLLKCMGDVIELPEEGTKVIYTEINF